MIFDANELNAEHVLKSDICVIGSGAAGMTIAKKLMGSSKRVLLLESGGFTFDSDVQDLYDGRSAGLLHNHPAYCKVSRLRTWGGSTNHWAGWCRPLDPFDFQKREWISGSGWPFSREDLEPYYHQAARLVEISKFDGKELEKTNWWRPPLDLSSKVDSIETKLFFYSPPTNFGTRYGGEVKAASNIDVCTHASCVDFHPAPNKKSVARVEAKTLDGKRIWIEAKQFALCTGGIETPRLLLNARRFHPAGLGNHGGMVGKFLMEHPHVNIGRVVVWHNWYLMRLYTGQKKCEALGHDTRAVLTTTPQFQSSKKTANFSAELMSDSFSEKKDDFELNLAQSLKAFDERIGNGIKRNAQFPLEWPYVRNVRNPIHCKLYLRAEQSPNALSQIRLDSEKDRLGLQHAVVDWRLSDFDYRSMYESAKEIGRMLGLSFRGRVRLEHEVSDPGTWDVHFGFHPSGTTRMGDDPKNVVDRNLKVHGIDNLYIASSSVYPTTGFANPTLTIVALSARLAEHLKTEHGGSQS